MKYGRGNGEVHGAIFGSRLLWLLGFHGDRVDLVRVSCRGCPEDPWDYLQGIDPSEPRPPPPAGPLREIAPAVVEASLGRQHVCIGSDASGFISPPREMRSLSEVGTLKAALLREFDDRLIVDDILANNAISFMTANWGT